MTILDTDFPIPSSFSVTQNPPCDFFWGSHGCALPKHDITVQNHVCIAAEYRDESDEEGWWAYCCEYREQTQEVRHNHGDGLIPEWGEWKDYGSAGWYQ